jgi:hypothetical protein
MAYTKVPTAIRESGKLHESMIYGFVTFYKMEDSQRVLNLKTVKFEELEHEIEIKPFNKKSTKLSIKYYTKKLNSNSDKRSDKDKPRKEKKELRGHRNPKQTMFMKSKSFKVHGS